jgi:4-hydroxybenzoate polyprenyltransferase
MAFISEPDSLRLLLGFIPLFLSYGLGQALTDCFQMDTDALSSPYRPLIKGIIARREVMAVSLTGLAAGIAVLAALNDSILLLGIPAVAGLLSYTYLKRTWWGGPFWNSWIVALLPFMGRLVQKDVGLPDLAGPKFLFSSGFLFAVLAVFFAYANFVVMGYFKDISADRATGYRTFPVVFGWRAAALASDFNALSAAAWTGLSLAILPDPYLLGRSVWVAAMLVNLKAQLGIHRLRDENLAHGPITDVVRSFLLYCGAIILGLKPGWVFFLTVYYLWFEVMLRLRPERRQV